MTIRPRKPLLNPDLRRPSALNSVPRSQRSIWLDKNESLDQALMLVAQEVMSNISPLAMATYPEAGALYRKLAAWVGVQPEGLLVTAGSDGAIRAVFEAVVGEGDHVVLTSPTFAMYPVYAQMFGAQACVVQYDPGESGPCLDPGRIIAAVRERRPKLLCLPNPDSPTGTILQPDVLRAILAECESAETLMLIDEAYHPFYEWSAASWTATSRNLVIARTFAKAWGAAGLRIGYLVAHPETAAYMHKMRPMYEVSTIAVEFMSGMLDRIGDMEQSVARIRDGKTCFTERMEALGFRVLPTHANYVHVAFAGAGRAVHAALDGKVLYRAVFEHPCLAGYSRFSIAPREVMLRVADLIETACRDGS